GGTTQERGAVLDGSVTPLVEGFQARGDGLVRDLGGGAAGAANDLRTVRGVRRVDRGDGRERLVVEDDGVGLSKIGLDGLQRGVHCDAVLGACEVGERLIFEGACLAYMPRLVGFRTIVFWFCLPLAPCPLPLRQRIHQQHLFR